MIATAGTTAPAQAGSTDQAVRAVVELLRAISRALRAHQLYGGANPALERQIEEARRLLGSVWERIDQVTLTVDEAVFAWDGTPVYQAETRADNLAFLFWKDGIREITLLPGLEDEELSRLLEVLARVHRVRAEEDDLLTLLWEQDFTRLRYRYTDSGEAVDALRPDTPKPPTVDAAELRQEVPDPVAQGFNVGDFNEALYFLDQQEWRLLRDELDREMRRDLWADIVAALLDRLEDGQTTRREQILNIFGEVLPASLSARRFDVAATLTTELARWLRRPDAEADPTVGPARALLSRLAEPDAVGELVRMVEDNPAAVPPETLASLIALYPADALGPLLRGASASPVPAARNALDPAVRALAARHPKQPVALLADPDAEIAAAAAGLVARLGQSTAAERIARLLSRSESSVRLAAITALQELRSFAGADLLIAATEDPDREIRIAAVRALAVIRPVAARHALESALASRRLREADLTEKIAFFEAYGALAGAEGISSLEKVLNGKSWLGRRESPEIRACAAAGLGRSGPAARSVLEAAIADPDPVVRTAAGKALRSLG